MLTDLVRPGGVVNAFGFGDELAISFDGSQLVVGAGWHEMPGMPGIAQGAVYLYHTNDLSFPTAILQPALHANDQFGYAVSLSADGGLLLVSAPGDDHNRDDDPGVYDPDYINDTGTVFVYDLTGEMPSLAATFHTPDGVAAFDRFGEELVLSADGSRALIWATQPGDNDTGRIHVYDFNGTEPTWVHTISNPVAPDGGSGADFGRGLAISANGGFAAIAAPFQVHNTTRGRLYEGEVFLYDLSGPVPVQTDRIVARDSGSLSSFGEHMALSDDGAVLVVGADDVSDAGTFDSSGGGSVYVYDVVDGEAVLRFSFTAHDNDTLDQFGQEISLTADGRTLLVGAPGWDGTALDTVTGSDVNDGTVYAYDISDDNAVLLAQFVEGDDQRIPAMGWEVAIAGDGSQVAAAWNRAVPLDQSVDVWKSAMLGFDRIIGGDSADLMEASRNSDAIFALGGDDLILARGGHDWLDAGAGDDRVHGAAGDDVIADGAGQDRLRGGSGLDIFILAADVTRDIVTDFESGTDLLDLRAWGVLDFSDIALSTRVSGFTRIAHGSEILIIGGSVPVEVDFLL